MRRGLAFLGQVVLFLLVFAVGSFFPPMHLRQVVSVSEAGTRVFFWDGLVLMAGVFVVILLIEAARRRLADAGRWTALAFLVAAVVGLASKFGFMTTTH